MEKVKRSGPAIFMYIVIAVTFMSSAICFILYYGGLKKKIPSHAKC